MAEKLYNILASYPGVQCPGTAKMKLMPRTTVTPDRDRGLSGFHRSNLGVCGVSCALQYISFKMNKGEYIFVSIQSLCAVG